MREGTPSPLRGRHATAPVQNILGGIARCPKCGSTMTRTTKGKSWHYLVCTKAKAGAGCAYELIRYHEVERAFVMNADRIVSGCPTPKDGELDDRIREVEAIIDALDDELRALADAVSGRGAVVETLVERMRAKEAQQKQLRAELRAMETRRAELASPVLNARLDELRAVLEGEPLDRNRANALLRVLLRGAVPDREAIGIWLEWKHGGQSHIVALDWAFVEE